MPSKTKNLSKARFQNAVPILHVSEIATLVWCSGVFQKQGIGTFRVVVRVVGERGRAYWEET